MEKCNQELDKKHFINVNPYGTFEPYRPILGGPSISKIDTSFSDVDDMFTLLENSNHSTIAIFFHGGLVAECKGMEAAERFHRFYNSATTYTVSFVWETGFLTSLIEHIKSDFLDGFLQTVYSKAAEYILSKLGIDVPDILDARDAKINYNYMATNLIADSKSQIELSAIEKYELASLEEIENDIVQDLSEFDRKLFIMCNLNRSQLKSATFSSGIDGIVWAGVKAAARCIYRFARKRNHAVKATILEEVYRQIKLGKVVEVESLAIGIWDEMKEVANKMWKDNSNRKENNQFAGRYFLDKLANYLALKQSKGEPVKLELVGHSAGSIAICELFDILQVNKKKYAHVKFNNVIFLAPAVKCDFFYKTLYQSRKLINRFRLFTMDLQSEQNDILIDLNGLRWVYPMSLLYFVSGLCEDGDKYFDEDIKGDACLLGLYQHISGNHPYSKYEILQEITEYLFEGGEYNNRIASIPSADDAPIGYRGRAKDHSDFDNDGDDLNPKDKNAGSIRESIAHLFVN